MLYDYIIIDTANLFYRLEVKNNENATIKALVNHINKEALPHLRKDGELYLIFDPISLSDIDESKAFNFTTTRKEINSSYKKNRTYSSIYKNVILVIQKYFAYRGEQIKEIYSDAFEADDFIEPLFKKIDVSKKIALVTTDLDYSRYITKNVSMINKGYDNPYEMKDFIETFKFKPTVAANTFYKAIFGDKSDNIIGCISLRKAKFLTNIKQTSYEFIKHVSDSGKSLDEALEEFKNCSSYNFYAKDNKNPVEKIYAEFSIASQKEEVMSTFYQNIKIIRSQLEKADISKFIHWNPEKPKFNEIQEQAIFGIKASSWFGKA